MTPELKACPFCGKRAKFHEDLPLPLRGCGVMCMGCCVFVSRRDEATSSAAWNARTAAEPKWRPIEEAPKDGTWILGMKNYPTVAAMRFCVDAWVDGAGNNRKPTVFMPLPPPPRKES